MAKNVVKINESSVRKIVSESLKDTLKLMTCSWYYQNDKKWAKKAEKIYNELRYLALYLDEFGDEEDYENIYTAVDIVDEIVDHLYERAEKGDDYDNDELNAQQ